MRELKRQFVNAFLVILAGAAVVCAVINFRQNFGPQRYRLPDDGITWVDRKLADGRQAVVALHVAAGSPGESALIDAGDELRRIGAYEIRRALDVAAAMEQIGAYASTEYYLVRGGKQFKAKVIIRERPVPAVVAYQYLIGLAYLGIGLFVHFRRGNASKSLHFLVLCLVSFVFSTFHYTGKLNNFDKVIYWGNVGAGLFAPAIFLHFCLTFPGTPPARRWVAAVYLPSLALLAVTWGVAAGMFRIALNPIELRWILDRIQMTLLSACYLAGAAVLAAQFRRTDDPVVRQQLKWLRNGALAGVLPFTCFYVIPYLLGVIPSPYMQLAVFSLPLVPLTWAYAVIRYRLMDVDVIFQQGYVYTLATLIIIGAVYGLFFLAGGVQDLSPATAILMIVVAAFIFQPIRNWVQEQLDRYYFYRDRYDYRRTLIEFARELSSETDLNHMLETLADRLRRTLYIDHVAFFLFNEQSGGFQLAKSAGREYPHASQLDLGFLNRAQNVSYLFFERPRRPLDVVSEQYPPSQRAAIAELDLTYYLPCAARGRTVAILGVSRTINGDFLSSDDLELLATLAGYAGIAIDNARLYSSLQRKVEEYEKLKEFSENIVESISVGVLAADLEDRVESWNTQIERMTGIPRQAALGRPLRELFPPELIAKLEEARNGNQIHNVYRFVLKPQGKLAQALQNGAIAPAAGNGNGASATQGQRVVNIAIAPLVTKENQQIGRLIIFDDITERSELEQQLVQADRLSSIGLLAAGVAHEVNTPLAVISTYAQMLAKQISGDEQKARLLEKIAKQTFRASEIVNSLLNFSRSSPSEFTEVDINRVISDTVNLVEHQLQKAQIAVSLQLEAGLGPVRGNAGKLQQVFLNLILNARDAMEGGGLLTIRSRAEKEQAVIEVADTGHGIAAEHLARIYDPFFTTKSGRKGTGLGLSVTYGIVKEHGGVIDVESSPGAGTTFRLKFQLIQQKVHV